MPLFGATLYGTTAYAGLARPIPPPPVVATRRVIVRFSIGRPDGVTWEDMTGYLASVTVSLGDVSSVGTGSAGIDERVRTAQFVLIQERTDGLTYPVPHSVWDEGLARDDTAVAGDEETVVGLETDHAGKLIDLLFGLEPETFTSDSLSPRDRASLWNSFGGGYTPLIWPRREVYLEVALVALDEETGGTTTYRGRHVGTGDGSTRTFYVGHRSLVVAPGAPLRVYLDGVEQEDGFTVDPDAGTVAFDVAPAAGVIVRVDYTHYYPLFHGQIDDWKVEGGRIVITCRDLAARLQDLYLLEPAEYGSEQGVPLETVMQQMLDDHLGPGVVQLYCPVSPGFMVTSYVAEYVTLWEALQTLASQTVGWYLGYRWREGTGRFELTLMEPPRDKDGSTADYHLTARGDILVNDLGGSIADVRNLVKVTYRDASTGERKHVTVSDQPSIDEYGLRPMAIEEGDTSPIDTEEEARALARAALADLKDQHATTLLELPLLPWLDLMDGVTIEDPRTSSTVDFYAVESVEHRLDWSDPERAVFRTSAVCSGKVAGAHVKWLAMQTRPGARGEPVPPEAVVGRGRALPRPPAPTVKPIIRGVAVDVPVPPVNVNRWAATEVHLSTTAGFSPSASTLVASGRETHFEITSGLTAGTTYYLRAFYVDLKGNKSLASDEMSVVAGWVTEDTVLAGALNDLKIYDFRSEVVTRSTSFVDMPDMNITYTVTKPGRLFIMVVAPVVGSVGLTQDIYPQTRLLIDGIVVQSDPYPAAPSVWYERYMRASTPGTYYFQREYLDPNALPVNINVSVQWRSAWSAAGDHERYVSNRGRGMAFILLK